MGFAIVQTRFSRSHNLRRGLLIGWPYICKWLSLPNHSSKSKYEYWQLRIGTFSGLHETGDPIWPSYYVIKPSADYLKFVETRKGNKMNDLENREVADAKAEAAVSTLVHLTEDEKAPLYVQVEDLSEDNADEEDKHLML